MRMAKCQARQPTNPGGRKNEITSNPKDFGTYYSHPFLSTRTMRTERYWIGYGLPDRVRGSLYSGID